MIGFRRRFGRGLAVAASLGLLGPSVSACTDRAAASAPVQATPQAQSVADLAEMCGLDINCEAGGIAEGRASISGLANVDAFFAAVINFEAKATASAAGIQAELSGIRADFGLEANADIGAAIMAQAEANLDGSLEIVAEPARCEVAASATVEAAARCDVEATPGSAMVMCQGGCEVEASANVDCGASAELSCTFQGPSVECSGSCRGTCTLEAGAMADCSGTCNGTCQGTCSAMNAMGECAGKCDGMCMGSCAIEASASASCEGTCNGECTVENPSGGCDGAVEARCEAMGNAMVMCEGRCDGHVTPPMVSAECQASAKAEASFKAECTPPRVDVKFELDASLTGSAELEAQAKFAAALRNLEVRLPKLLASIKGANVAIEAAADLGDTGVGAVRGAIMGLNAGADVKATIGLTCALGELDAVGAAISGGTTKLTGAVQATAELTGALGL